MTFLEYLLLATLVSVAIYGLTYLYYKLYEKGVNWAFIRDYSFSSVSPILFMIILLVILVVTTILINIFPIYTFEQYQVNPEESLYVELQENKYNPFDFYEFTDISENNEGYKVVSLTENTDQCFELVTEPCSSTRNIYSAIVMYDEENNVLWQTNNHSENIEYIEFNQYQFDAQAITFLENGKIAAFGKSWDTTTNMRVPSILILNENGVMEDIITLDLSDYGYVYNGGHQYYEIIAADDGFTVKYINLFKGTVLVHFDSTYTEVWNNKIHLGSEDEQGAVSSLSYKIDTLFYDGNTYYTLNRDTIEAYNTEGELLWEKEFDYSLTGINLVDDELMVFGAGSNPITERENLFEVNEEDRSLGFYQIDSIERSTGETINSFQYQYTGFYLNYDYLRVLPQYITKDNEGNYYLMSQSNNWNLDNQGFILHKLDKDFEFIGTTSFPIQYDKFADYASTYQAYNYFDEDQLIILRPLSSNNVSINISKLEFKDTNITTNLEFHNGYLQFRVHMVYVTTIVLIEYLIGFVIYVRFLSENIESPNSEALRRWYEKE